MPKIHLPPGWGSHEGKPGWDQKLPALSLPRTWAGRAHDSPPEDSERAMQERVQRLEAAPVPSKEVSWVAGSVGGWVWLEGVPRQGPRTGAAVTVCGVGAEPGEGRGTQ